MIYFTRWRKKGFLNRVLNNVYQVSDDDCRCINYFIKNPCNVPLIKELLSADASQNTFQFRGTDTELARKISKMKSKVLDETPKLANTYETYIAFYYENSKSELKGFVVCCQENGMRVRLSEITNAVILTKILAHDYINDDLTQSCYNESEWKDAVNSSRSAPSFLYVYYADTDQFISLQAGNHGLSEASNQSQRKSFDSGELENIPDFLKRRK